LHKYKSYKKYNGFSLVELLVALGIFMVIATTLIVFSIDSAVAIRNSWDRVEGTIFLQKIVNILDIKKADKWSNIGQIEKGQEYCVDLTSPTYEIIPGRCVNGVFEYFFILGDVYRDENRNIVDSGGTLDLHSRRLDFTITWLGYRNHRFTLTDTKFINDWSSFEWKQTTQDDFNLGSHNLTETVADGDGAVKMERIIYGDWCNPTLTISYYDMPGQGIPKSIYGIPGDLSMGTGGNASGFAYMNVLVNTDYPPVMTEQETFDGYKTNNVYAEPQFVYLATDTNQKEVVILDRETTPITEIGYFDIPGNDDGVDVFVSNNVGYVLGNSALYLFDLSSKYGSRPIIGSSISIPTSPIKVIVKDNYAFVLSNNATNQLHIIDLNSKTIVGTASIDYRYATDMYINNNSTRAYIVTQNSTSYNEFYIIDISTKTGSRPIINKFELGGMSATGVTIIEENARAIVVGTGGTEQYQVFIIDNEYAVTKCGGLTVSEGIFDVTSLVDSMGSSYSYIITGHSSRELQIIRGGPGGGDGTGYGYSPTAQYTSVIFDSQYDMSTMTMLDVIFQQPAGSNIKFQVRSGNQADLSDAVWFGPDGTEATYFSGANTFVLPIINDSTRYFQYKIFFESNTAVSPILEEMIIGYEK